MNFIKKNYYEIIFYFLFCIGITTISFFHEPRFDEFQAWGISKEPINYILFTIPHYECHSPLWFLILKLFSSSNITPEIGIKIPNIMFMLGSVYLLMFKSPFPRIIKTTLPFTFYIFFQYSVINRPYSILCFALFLIATLYEERNKKPFLYASAIALLSLSCIYGIAIAIGIAVVWIIELIQKYKKNIFKHKVFIAIGLFFLFSIILIALLFPAKDSDKYFSEILVGSQFLTYKNYLLSFIFSISGIFAEITYLYCYSFIVETIYTSDTKDFFNIFLSSNFIIFVKFFLICFLGLLINIFLLFNFKRKKVLLLFLIPFCFLSILYTVHFAPHHIGLLLIFIIFVYWCAGKINEQTSSNKLEKFLRYILLFGFITIQIFWNIKSCIKEVLYPASPAKEIQNFIKNNNLDKYNIMGQYLNYTNLKNTNIEHYNVLILSTVINQYFDRNIFYNLNPNTPEKTYVFFKVLSEDESQNYKNLVKQKGIPDIVVGEVNTKDFFDTETNYILAKSFNSVSIYKHKTATSKHNIYIKEDLYNKISLK